MNFIASMAFVVLVVHINVNNAIRRDMPEMSEMSEWFLKRGANSNGHGRYHGILYECHKDNWQKRDEEAKGTFTFTNGRFSYKRNWRAPEYDDGNPPRGYCYLTLKVITHL